MSHDHIHLYCPKDNVAQYFCVVVIFRHAPFNIAAQFYNLQHIFLWTTQIWVVEPQGTPDITLRNSVLWHDSNSPLIFPRVALAASSIQLVCQRCRLQPASIQETKESEQRGWEQTSLMEKQVSYECLYCIECFVRWCFSFTSSMLTINRVLLRVK